MSNEEVFIVPDDLDSERFDTVIPCPKGIPEAT